MASTASGAGARLRPNGRVWRWGKPAGVTQKTGQGEASKTPVVISGSGLPAATTLGVSKEHAAFVGTNGRSTLPLWGRMVGGVSSTL